MNEIDRKTRGCHRMKVVGMSDELTRIRTVIRCPGRKSNGPVNAMGKLVASADKWIIHPASRRRLNFPVGRQTDLPSGNVAWRAPGQTPIAQFTAKFNAPKWLRFGI
jgi:hypothetical protein